MKRKSIISVLLILCFILSGCQQKNTFDELNSSSKKEKTELTTPDINQVTEIPNEHSRLPNSTSEYLTTDTALYYFSDEAMMPEYSTLTSEEYLTINQNSFSDTNKQPVITFSLKTSTAAYSNVKRYINDGHTPPTDAVRTEELLNYFSYEEDAVDTDSPFSIYSEIGPSPFNSEYYLALVRVKTKEIDTSSLPYSNLTFLIDTSGSMDSPDKLPLLKSAFSLLVDSLSENDTISIVTYAGSSEIVLDSVNASNKEVIMNAIDNLTARGSTAGSEGILTAYKLCEKNYIEGGNNRIILASDGDFNVGVATTDELEQLVLSKKEQGIYLSVMGFGTGNLKDNIMETIAQNGNGNYSYIDSISTAQKVLVKEMGSTLYTVADDVKAQLEFNPDYVESYRLIGYEHTAMANEDFDNDQKDAGEIGMTTDVITLVELKLKSEPNNSNNECSIFAECLSKLPTLFQVNIRYKEPNDSKSQLITFPVTAIIEQMHAAQINFMNSADFRFASAVASFCELLRDSQYSDNLDVDTIIAEATYGIGTDENGYRNEFLMMLYQYKYIR
jgi:Uncharacterized protein containing a von Willebrand factor type A (vWA) domain